MTFSDCERLRDEIEIEIGEESRYTRCHYAREIDDDGERGEIETETETESTRKKKKKKAKAKYEAQRA